MKIDLKELKAAIAWYEANTNSPTVTITQFDGKTLSLKSFDKYDSEVEITLYPLHGDGQSSMLPKIKKTEVLKVQK